MRWDGWIPPVRWCVFTDVTRQAGLDLVREQFDTGVIKEQNTQIMRGVVAALDYDMDGDTDLFILGADNAPDLLYRNEGDGTFTDMAVEAGVADLHMGSGVTVADYDADGDPDIFVTSLGDVGQLAPGGHRLYRNDGNGGFTNVAGSVGLTTTSAEIGDGLGAAFGDIDLDGDLDLMVAGWQKEAQGNRLFRNDGDRYVDITHEAGIVDDGIRGFSPCLVDTNGDFYPEILLVADFGTSRYFANRTDGTFREWSVSGGTAKEWSGMGTAVGDVDGNGMIDWYVTAVYDDEASGRGDGNKLYLNQGGHTFDEVAAGMGVDDGGWGWGALVADINLDGRLDIVEVNGWPFPVYTDEMAKLWIGQEDGTFIDVAADAGLDHNLMGLSLLDLDYDGDGDLDLVVTTPDGEFRLYRNDLAGDNHWLRVVLDPAGDPAIPPHGMGARIIVEAGGTVQYRWIAGCSNYLTGAEPSAHVGLGGSSIVDRVVVEWPNGSVTEMTSVIADQVLTVTPPAP